MNNYIEELERRYQALQRDFQSGGLDEATFVAEVDVLQFQDEWGRYWMIGAQTGSWHYYDGQNWHQADPRDADKLPFLDENGVYWQRGVKSGDWYYYQADTEEWVKPSREDDIKPPTPRSTTAPRSSAVKAPVREGRGAATREGRSPKATSTRSRAVSPGEPKARADSYPQQIYPTASGPQGPDAVADTELFQDDEGRYWSIGAKSGQWYFYDHDGWHPAHEFQPSVAAVTPPQQPYVYGPAAQPAPFYPGPTPPPPAYPYLPPTPYPAGYNPQQAQAYAGSPYPAQPVNPMPQQTSPAQPGPAYPSQPHGVGQPPVQPGPSQPLSPLSGEAYAPPPVIDQAVQPPPVAKQVETAATAAEPNPPKPGPKSGSWFYFDGNQWLKYSSGETAPGAVAPPEPKQAEAQPPVTAKAAPKEEEPAGTAEPVAKKAEAPAKAEATAKTQEKAAAAEPAVVAELFEEDEAPPPEVVDVEIVTVIEAEPDVDPYDETPAKVREATARSTGTREPLRRRGASYAASDDDEARPRRTTSSPQTRPVGVERPGVAPVEPQRQVRTRTASDPGRPVIPRKRDVPQEPTIIVPTESTGSSPGLAQGRRPASRPVRRPFPNEQRARENTIPMEPVAPAAAARPVAGSGQATQVTQPMPVMARSDSALPQPGRADPAGMAMAGSAGRVEPEKSGYTFGDVLRSFPSTFWTFVGGMLVLVIFFAVIIFAAWWGLPGSDSGASGVLAAVSATATLDIPGPNQTPTLVPTATTAPELFASPEPAVFATYSSEDLDLTVEYPENWQMEDDETLVIFSPSSQGLDPDTPADSAFWIEKSTDDLEIPDLLAKILAKFPADSETLNKNSISIASQTWTSTQIRYQDETQQVQSIATVAVTKRDGIGYTLVAVAAAEAWNSVQPTYQEMINSFRFGLDELPVAAVDQADAADDQERPTAGTPSTASQAEATEAEAGSTTAAAAKTPTPAPTVKATPVVHVIVSGDTLLAIANRYGVDVDLLAKENGITNPNALQLGQELIIPFTDEQLQAYNAGKPLPSEVKATAPAAAEEEEEEEAAASSGGSSRSSGESEQPVTSPDTGQNQADAAAALSGRIVYPAFNPGNNNYDVWMYNIGSGEQTIIAGEASQPTFNRDGSLLAYRSWTLDSRGIFFRDFVGGRGGKVTRFVEDGLPTWSPDGFSFVFSSRREGDRVPRLYRGNQQGDGDEGLGFNAEYVSAFPDGRLVAKGCSPSGDCGIYLLGANGLGPSKISGETRDTAPAVSPDGNRIAFMSSGRGATNWEIWVMGADGSNPVRLTENGSNEGLPAWSPDGKSLAYVSDQGGSWAIWVMNANGTNQRKLVNMSGSPDGLVLHAGDNSRGWLEERISWAP